MPTAARRKLGTEPLGVDFVVGPTVLTAADYQELDAFFRERRQRNAQSPTVRAIRQQLAAKRGGASAGTEDPARGFEAPTG